MIKIYLSVIYDNWVLEVDGVEVKVGELNELTELAEKYRNEIED